MVLLDSDGAAFANAADLMPPLARDRSRWASIIAMVKTGVLAAIVLACLQLASPTVGLAWSTQVSATLLFGVLLMEALPGYPFAVGSAMGAAVLLQTARLPLVLYLFALTTLAFAARKRAPLFFLILLAGVIVVPKELFRCFYHTPALHDWVKASLLAHVFYVSALWWRERREGRPQNDRFEAWTSLFFFPGFAATPVAFAPSVLWRARSRTWRQVAESLALVLSKAAAIWLLGRLWPDTRFSGFSRDRLLGMSCAELWGVLGVHYLKYTLALSGAFDVAVTMTRLFGWPVQNAFRWVLLAWNPVELWRRWSIYSRKLLLKLVYFPLGGGNRHRLRNVMLTFLASGLVLHSGFLGSPYWEVSLPGLRDWTVYFALQGIAVCGCLVWWRLRGKDPASDRNLRLSAGRVLATLLTQAGTAWLHILVFAPQIPWPDRWRLMLHCLSIGQP